MAPEVRAAFDAGVDALRAAGTSIEAGTIDGTDAITKTYVDIVLPEAAQWHRRYLDTRGPGYTPAVFARLVSGRDDFGRRLPDRARDAAATAPARSTLRSTDVDAIVLPTLPITAPPARIDRRRAGTERPGAQRARGDAPQHAALQSDRSSGDLAAAPRGLAARRPAARGPARRDAAALGDRGGLREDRLSADRVTSWPNRFLSLKRTPCSSRAADYVDVRSTPEFADGHPAGAANVPIFEPDEDTGR